MGFQLKQLWSAPEINPYNKKAKSIPIFNPFDKYGRVFFFSYLGFFIAFWSWYAFPPLLSVSIRQDMHLSQNEVANSNIIALTATLLVRAIAGPMCDNFGPRKTFATLLFLGAVPTAMAGTAHNAMGLYFIRFFVGILGGTFVPCQVWTTGFYDRNIVGTANALVGGWGNSGGGITYFVMPAIYDSLRHDRGLSSHVSWRVSFIVPFILITSVASGLLLLTEDTPTGKWSERGAVVAPIDHSHASVVPTAGGLADKPSNVTSGSISSADEKKQKPLAHGDVESATGDVQIIDEVQHEIVVKPTFKEAMKVVLSPQTLMLCAGYVCSFGGELAINSILGSYYLKNFPALGQTNSGRWAAMFGLLNVITRPLGGFIGDVIYRSTNHNLWAKKFWIHFVGVMSGIFLIIIGKLDSHDRPTMIGLVALMAIFLEAGNGANFALVPHIHPHANGILSGIVGASGNFGGIIFAIIFRYHGKNYAQVFWIIGIIVIILNTAFMWVRPIPKGQIGGR
ncbi:nitrate transporter-like protein [Dothidotthia symphoricarpi CBS 119687]|uniref:Nitrate/nitrite transporter n=1 Tax=Dothidotthia symphoricarpi CBS 119687 TaxID=1392245 RepID=A0A6A6A5S5_9PLEO|nr:nitrate transporter-like protein [Dothidotthia symphoricarpi CBS 119687]KAF2126267.1 nitrate transporter-like protein [Dothidotthia symphoricarpi CBS 119687]